MDYSILLMADILITAAILYVLFHMNRKRAVTARGANKVEKEALQALRKGIENLDKREDEMAEKQKILKDVIDRLDGALADIHGVPDGEIGEEANYSAARTLLRQGEPVEKVIELFNLSKGEADVLSSINAMAS